MRMRCGLRHMSGCDPGSKHNELTDERLPAPAAIGRATTQRRLRCWIGLMCTLLSASSWAQTHRRSEAITGVVEDPTGAVIQGAKVTLLSADNPATLAGTESGRTGEFRLLADPGTYTVIVEAAGFARYESEPAHLDTETERLEVRLKLPTKVEQIDVPGESRGNHGGNGPRHWC